MTKQRESQRKPLSFSTTMRNPDRIAGFLKIILPFENQILTDEITYKVAAKLISEKLYTPLYIGRTPALKAIWESDRSFSEEEVAEIMQNSPQDHKEAGFEKGWPSRFDTWYKLPMEFGFLYYELNKPIEISETGHMLIDAYDEDLVNNEKIKNVFLNSLIKYQTDNPFRRNANRNSPLILLLQVIKLLKNDPEENDVGVFRKELSLLICWPDNNANAVYKKIKEVRKKFGFNYGDEIIYEICLDLLEASDSQRNRFKMNQITGEAVDEYIRKMRITGIVSLRGNGRFLDENTFESEKITYVLEHYSDYEKYDDKFSYYEYMGDIDPIIVSIIQPVDETLISDIRISTLHNWSVEYSRDQIFNELRIINKKTDSKNEVLKFIDRPTRLEFLVSIVLKQNFCGMIVYLSRQDRNVLMLAR